MPKRKFKKMNFNSDDIFSNSATSFEDSIDDLARINSEFMFRTFNLKQASIVMAKILEYSKKEVFIYDHCINGDIADKHYLFDIQLNFFLEAGKKFNLVVRDDRESNSKIFQTLSEFAENYSGQIDVRLVSNEFKQTVINTVKNDANFIVNDKRAFRLETLENCVDTRDNVEALCCFNNQEISDQLNKIFSSQFSSCTQIRLPIPA